MSNQPVSGDDHNQADEAVKRVVEAWTNPGPRPDWHRSAQRGLRREWPTLADAIEALVREVSS